MILDIIKYSVIYFSQKNIYGGVLIYGIPEMPMNAEMPSCEQEKMTIIGWSFYILLGKPSSGQQKNEVL